MRKTRQTTGQSKRARSTQRTNATSGVHPAHRMGAGAEFNVLIAATLWYAMSALPPLGVWYVVCKWVAATCWSVGCSFAGMGNQYQADRFMSRYNNDTIHQARAHARIDRWHLACIVHAPFPFPFPFPVLCRGGVVVSIGAVRYGGVRVMSYAGPSCCNRDWINGAAWDSVA